MVPQMPSTKIDHKVFVRSSQNLSLARMERARRELQNDPQKCIEIRRLSKVMIDSSLRLHRRPKGVLLVYTFGDHFKALDELFLMTTMKISGLFDLVETACTQLHG